MYIHLQFHQMFLNLIISQFQITEEHLKAHQISNSEQFWKILKAIIQKTHLPINDCFRQI